MNKSNILKESLLKFLIEQDSLSRFSNNLEISFEDFINSEEALDCISAIIKKAFSWGSTEEGKEYWQRISGKWSTYLFENKRIYKEIEEESRNILRTKEIYS